MAIDTRALSESIVYNLEIIAKYRLWLSIQDERGTHVYG